MTTGAGVAAVQMVSGPDVAANLAQARELVTRAVAAGAKFVGLPENAALMTDRHAQRLEAAEPEGSGPIQDFFAALAARERVWLLAGTVPLRGDAPGRVRASSLLYDDAGRLAARYDKMHLFDVSLETGETYTESKFFEAGDRVSVADTPFGRLGLAVCYDLRFPELFRRMLDQGATLFALPSAFTAVTGRAHWEVLVRARAIENLAYVIAPAQGGRHPHGRETHGDSMIVDPWGAVLARCERPGPGLALATLDLDRQHEHRRRLPCIEHRRSS